MKIHIVPISDFLVLRQEHVQKASLLFLGTHEDPPFCQEHNEHYIRWVRFKAGEIPQSEIGCVEGSFLNPRQEPGVQEHE